MASYFRGVLSRSLTAPPLLNSSRTHLPQPIPMRGMHKLTQRYLHRVWPTLVLLVYAPQPSAKIPLWEQQLSVGAVGMNLLHAAHAHGFVGSWITGWATYDDSVRKAICVGDEQIAGLFFMGSPALPLEERPRPDPSNIIRQWP
jgi:nitroreductase